VIGQVTASTIHKVGLAPAPVEDGRGRIGPGLQEKI